MMYEESGRELGDSTYSFLRLVCDVRCLPRHDEGDGRVTSGHNTANSKVTGTKGSGRSEKGDERNEKSG